MTAPRLRLDLENQCLWRGEEPLEIKPKAFALLTHLQRNHGRLVTKNELIQAVWPDTHVGDAVLTVTVKQLRDLVGDDPRQPWFIETLHRRGYRLIAELRVEAPGSSAPSAKPMPAAGSPSRRGIVGREAAFAQLDEAMARAIGGQRQLLFVTGEPGIGKTALVDELGWRLPEPMLVGRGQCLEEYGSTEAYLPVLDAMEDLLRKPEAAGLVERMQRCAPTWMAQFPWLMPTGAGEAVPVERPGATRERMLRELCAALELGSTEMPIVLILEDLHWSDPSTVALLSYLGQRRAPARLLVVGTYRPVDAIVANHPIREARQRLQTSGLCVEVPLWYLARDDVRRVLERRLGGAVDESAVEQLHRRSNGNPLFLTSLLEPLLQAGGLFAAEGVWRLAAEEREEVPSGVSQIVEPLLARLDAADLAVLEAASVVGFEFATPIVAACLERDANEVEPICERLARRGDLLRSVGTVAADDGTIAGRYQFVHALFQNVLYQRIGAARRATSHRRIGDWGEKHGAGAGELAHHFALAGTAASLARAIEYGRLAAAKAKSLFAYEEAVTHLLAALAIARRQGEPDPVLVCSLTVELAEAQQRAGQIVTAERTFHRAATSARELDEPCLLARSAIGIGHGYQRIGQRDPLLIELLEESLRRLPPADHPLRALALVHLDYSLASLPGEQPGRRDLSRQAMAMARRLDDPETLVWVMQYTRWAFRGPQNAAEWRAAVAEIERLLGRVHDAEQALVLRCLLVADYLELGEMEQVQQALATLMQCAEEAQLPWALWLTMRLRSTVALLCGPFEEAQRLLLETLEVGQRTEHPNVAHLYLSHLAILLVEQGRLEEVAPLVRQAVEENPAVPCWRAVLAYLLAELGELEPARVELDRLSQEGFADVPHDTVWLVLMAFAAGACRALGDRARGAVVYEALLPHRERCTGAGSSVLPLGHIGRYLGLAAAAAGRDAEARQHFEEAIAVNRRMEAWPWLALTLYDCARARETSGTNRRESARWMEEAGAIMRRIGMAGWLSRL